MAKSSHLNLWCSDDLSSKGMDIDVSSSLISLTSPAASTVKITPALSLVDSVNGDVANVSTKLYALESSIATGQAGSAAASALVQSNLDAYETSNNAALATLNATVTSNRALAVAAEIHDANARTALDTSLTTLITDEETARVAADNTLTTALATAVSNRIAGDAAVTGALNAYITANDAALATETGRIDGILAGSSVDLNSFLEVVTAYSNADTSILSTIGSIQTQLTALQATVDALVDGN